MQSLCQKAFYTDLTCLCWKRGESFASGQCSCQSHPKSDREKHRGGMPRAAQTPPPARERDAKWRAQLHASTLKMACLFNKVNLDEGTTCLGTFFDMFLDYVKRISDQNTCVCTYSKPSVKAASITKWNLHWCQPQSSTEQNIAELGSWGLWLPFKQVERSTNETLVSGDPRAKESMDRNDNARDCRKQ